MAEWGGLENRYSLFADPGFESLTLRLRSPKHKRRRSSLFCSAWFLFAATFGGRSPPQFQIGHSILYSKNLTAMHYVYILRRNDGSTYTGCTHDLKERFHRHINGQVPATKPFLPVELIFYCAFKDKYKAFEFEKYLKSGSGRAFMNKRFL